MLAKSNGRSVLKIEILIIFTYLVLPCIIYYRFFSGHYGLAAILDNASFYVPSIKLLVQKILHGDSLLWNEYIIAGHPFLAEIQTGAFYPVTFLYLLLPFQLAFNYSILLHFSLAGWFTYLYLRSIHLSKTAAFFGGSVFMFCFNYHVYAGSMPMLYTVTWFPLIMYFLEKRISSGQKKFLLLAALAFVMQIFAGFIQDSIYTAFVITLYAAVRYCNYPKPIQSFFYDMVIFSLIVISFAAIQLFPTQELLTFMSHAGQQSAWEMIKSYSAPPLGYLSFFSPFLWGKSTIMSPLVGPTIGYFLPVYMGTLTIILAIYALRFWKVNNVISIWFTLFVLSLIAAAGIYIMPVAKLLFSLPIAHDLRVHSRMYFISSMAIVVLFSYGLDYIIKLDSALKQNELKKILALGMMIGLGIFIFTVGMITGIASFNDIASKLQGLTANGLPAEKVFRYYHFFNRHLFIPFVVFIIGGILLLVKKWRISTWCVFWLICMFDVGFISITEVKKLHSPLSDFSSNTMLKLKAFIKPTERMWVIYPTIIDSIKQAPSMNSNANVFYNMQGIDGYVNFTDKPIKSLPNRDLKTLTRLSLLQYGGNYLDLLQNHNDFLSMLGIKYLVIDKIHSAHVEAAYQKIPSDWRLLSQFSGPDIGIGENPSGNFIVTNHKIAVKPNTFYKVNLEVENGINNLFYINFSNENYNNLAQFLMFVPEKSDQNHFSGIINSGETVPHEVYLRTVTAAKNLKIKKLTVFSASGKSVPSIYKKIFVMDDYKVYQNPNAKERVYSVSDLRFEHDVDYMDVNLLKTAVIDKNVKTLSPIGVAKINETIYHSGDVKSKVDCPTNQCFIILSESYFPGWKVYVDGNKHDLYKVNDLIMGTFVGKGEHWLRFHYFPDSFIAGIVLFLFGLIWVPVWMFLPKKMRFSDLLSK